MTFSWPPAIPAAGRWRIVRARAPATLLAGERVPADREGLADIDLLVEGEQIAAISPADGEGLDDLPTVDLDRGLVLPCFADVHTHLDKGHIWARRPNPDGSWGAALVNAGADREALWSAEDLRRRMDFALRCAYAHGTSAIRTHLDSIGKQVGISWPVFAQVREAWRGRVELEAAPLFLVEQGLDDRLFDSVLEAVRETRGTLLGAVTVPGPALQPGLDRIFCAASERGLDLDFHVDETHDPDSRSLRTIAETAMRYRFGGKILAGHCCSLAQQDESEADRTMDLVAEAGLGIVSLPMCNLYLQDRGGTPRWRGVTLLHELAARGVPVMVASDNTRDPFYAYGDLDMVEVLREAVRILHLDAPFGDWPAALTRTPAAWMGFSGGMLGAGRTADLVLFRARTLNELLARPQADRVVLRAGSVLAAAPPDYRELDDLMGEAA